MVRAPAGRWSGGRAGARPGRVDGVAVNKADNDRGGHGGVGLRNHDREAAMGEFQGQGQAGERRLRGPGPIKPVHTAVPGQCRPGSSGRPNRRRKLWCCTAWLASSIVIRPALDLVLGSRPRARLAVSSQATADNTVADQALGPYRAVDHGVSPYGKALSGGEKRFRLPAGQCDSHHDTPAGLQWQLPIRRDHRGEVHAVTEGLEQAAVVRRERSHSARGAPRGTLRRRRIERDPSPGTCTASPRPSLQADKVGGALGGSRHVDRGSPSAAPRPWPDEHDCCY